MKPPTRSPSPAGGAGRRHRPPAPAPGGDRVGQHRQRAVAAAVEHVRAVRPWTARRRSRRRTASVSSSSSTAARYPTGSPDDLDRRRRAALRMAQHQPRLDGAVVGVALELEGRVVRLIESAHRLAVAAERDRARPRSHPTAPRTGRGGPPPSCARRRTARPGPAAAAPGWPSRTARAPPAPRPGQAELVAGDDRVDALDRRQQLGRQDARRRGARTPPRSAGSSARVERDPAAARCPP